jgi:protein-tyrosine sulfotransferase
MVRARDPNCNDPDLSFNPVFIHGITERSGTNFLFHLLCLHPGCDAGGPIWENYLLNDSDLFGRYVDSIYREWNAEWRVGERIGPPDLLLNYLGNALIAFLNQQKGDRVGSDDLRYQGNRLKLSPKRLVTKTPNVSNLGYFFKLFPEARLLILIRDGRAVVESSIKSFGGFYETAMRRWADAARVISRFDREFRRTHYRYLVVKYEDIYLNREAELRKIFAFLELNAEAYDFDAAKSLPVIGTSELRQHGQQKIHWKQIAKTSEFNPLGRWSHWGRARNERFNWIAGNSLSEFGYSFETYSKHRWAWTGWNLLLDVAWAILSRMRRLRALFNLSWDEAGFAVK